MKWRNKMFNQKLIDSMSNGLLSAAVLRKAEMEKLSKLELEDLIHRCGEVSNSPDWSVRTSVQMHKELAELIIEERKLK
jgi:chromosome condensin MukBEF complex kleisin-like MukF subunit